MTVECGMYSDDESSEYHYRMTVLMKVLVSGNGSADTWLKDHVVKCQSIASAANKLGEGPLRMLDRGR